jgi:hypothetical protein
VTVVRLTPAAELSALSLGKAVSSGTLPSRMSSRTTSDNWR